MKPDRPTSNRSRVFTAILVLILGSPGIGTAAPGGPVPAFDLVDLAGNRHTADDNQGHILLLFFVGHN
jgi:hypothetical protein